MSAGKSLGKQANNGHFFFILVHLSYIRNKFVGATVATAFVTRLTELEEALEKEQNAIRFYTPAAPLTGLGMVGTHATAQERNQQNSYINMNVGGEVSDGDQDIVDEYQDMESGSDRMEELEDSTESHQRS
jgi:hypothetical protein